TTTTTATSTATIPMPGQYQQPPKPLQQPTIPAHHHQQQQQQQQLPPSLPQQQQPMQSPNFYLQQQQQQQQPPPPPQSQGITATRPTGATMPQGPTDAAAQPRLMPHPISSYSSMKQGAPGSSGPPLTMASAGYSNGMPSAPPRQQPQFAPQGGYAAPQQNYVDPSRPLPPPPLPSGSRGPSMPGGQALVRPPQLAGIQQMQQPMSSQGTGVAPPPPPPPHPGAPGVPPQQAGGFVGSSQPLPRVSANASTYSSGMNDDTPVGNINSQGAISSLYGNPSASTVPLAPSTNAAASVTAPPPVKPMMPVPGNPPFGVTTREDSMGGSLTNSYGIGNANYQASLTPLENKVLPQNNMPRPPTAAVAPSTYGLQPNANKSFMPSPYGSSVVPSAMASRVPGGMPFTAPSTVDDADLSHFDITSLNPSYHAIAQKLCADVQQVSNVQRRLVISKAALELFKLLQRGALSPDVVFLVSNYVNSMGTPLAKNAWRQLSDAHFDVVQPFLNLKFLSNNDGAPN
ncbi:protein transport protein Sec31, putative, partial [Trypanosoma cruzi marinkellei]